MLIKGASRSIKDKKGRKPIDMIDPSIQPFQLGDIVKILGRQPISIPGC